MDRGAGGPWHSKNSSVTARQSRDGKLQIQNSRPYLPEKFASKATNYDLVAHQQSKKVSDKLA
jgi:hypothetical protein